MASAREMRLRIKSVKNISQVTRALGDGERQQSPQGN